MKSNAAYVYRFSAVSNATVTNKWWSGDRGSLLCGGLRSRRERTRASFSFERPREEFVARLIVPPSFLPSFRPLDALALSLPRIVRLEIRVISPSLGSFVVQCFPLSSSFPVRSHISCSRSTEAASQVLSLLLSRPVESSVR